MEDAPRRLHGREQDHQPRLVSSRIDPARGSEDAGEGAARSGQSARHARAAPLVGKPSHHGTDAPYGVGRKASHGCIRLYPEDIPHLFDVVPLKARVIMVREPLKVGLRRGRVHVEVHDDPDARIDLRAEARRLLSKRGLAARVDTRRLEAALEERRGIPVDVSLEGL